jgi:hypothetical protein
MSWMLIAFCAALLLASAVLAMAGVGEKGTDTALAATGRFSFLLFWPAYTGKALATLFGSRFRPLQKNGREFGLAFASAHIVHLGLVGWLCYIGAIPGVGTFIIFGIAAFFLYLLAILSINRLRLALGQTSWWWIRVIAMNYILYAFAHDFLRHPFTGGINHVVFYVPFAILVVLGPLLLLVSFAFGGNLRARTVPLMGGSR